MGNSWGNTYIPRLLLIITLRFSCCERNIWKNIKNFQTITTRVIWKLSLWTGPIVINSHIFAGIYFILLREPPRPNLKVFNTKLAFHLKGRKSSHQVRQISALFCNLIALIFRAIKEGETILKNSRVLVISSLQLEGCKK